MASLASSAIDEALRAYEQRSLGGITLARSLTFLIILAWLWLNYGTAIAAENAGVLSGFVALGLLALAVRRRWPEADWLLYLFVTLDVLLLAYTLLAPGRTYPESWPWQTVLRQPSFLYFLIILALATLSFRAWLVAWTGVVISAVWLAGTWLVARTPGTLADFADLGPNPAETVLLQRYLAPTYVHVDDALVRVFTTLVVTAILAIGAHRARRLIRQEAEAARQRANLARYVAPNMVERLARLDRPMAAARSQDAAVLFADIRGFTALAETMTPQATMGLLRDYHARMAEVVFAHGGTLDKFIGDGLMATFGTPETAADDALRAITCGRAMLAAVERWNVARGAAGEAPLAIGIGVHYGPVMMGDVGGAQRFEFSVIGDTVNVASRLEELTARLGEAMLVSDAAITAAGLSGRSGFACLGPMELRGRNEATVVWALRS
jgi:adenylate cyclase